LVICAQGVPVGLRVLVDAVQGHRLAESRLVGRDAALMIEVPVAGPGLGGSRLANSVEDLPVPRLSFGTWRGREVTSREPEDVLLLVEAVPEVAAVGRAHLPGVDRIVELLPPTLASAVETQIGGGDQHGDPARGRAIDVCRGLIEVRVVGLGEVPGSEEG